MITRVDTAQASSLREDHVYSLFLFSGTDAGVPSYLCGLISLRDGGCMLVVPAGFSHSSVGLRSTAVVPMFAPAGSRICGASSLASVVEKALVEIVDVSGDFSQLASRLTARVRSSYSSCAATAPSGLSFGRLHCDSVVVLHVVRMRLHYARRGGCGRGMAACSVCKTICPPRWRPSKFRASRAL